MKTMAYSGPHGEEFPEAVWVPNSLRFVVDGAFAEVDYLIYVSKEAIAAGKVPLVSETYRIDGDAFAPLFESVFDACLKQCDSHLGTDGVSKLSEAVEK